MAKGYRFMFPYVRRALILAPLCLAGCFQGKTDISQELERARTFVSDGNLSKAKIELRNALKKMPSDPGANLAMAKVEEASGDLKAALPYYNRAAAPDARLLDAQLRMADILLDVGQYQEALGRVNATLGSFVDNNDALALRADAEERQGQSAAALSDANKALQKDPSNPRALAVSAMLRLREKDGQRALDLASRGLARHPNDPRLLQVQAVALLTLNQPEKALDALKAIVRNAPGNVGAQIALANLEAKEGRLDQAIEDLKLAVKSDPANSEMQLALINFLASNKKSDEVVAYVEDLIRQNSAASTYDLVLAEYYINQGNLTAGDAVLDRAVGRLGSNPAALPVWTARAKVAAMMGNYQAAETDLNNVFSVDTANADALRLKAAIALESGQTGLAAASALAVLRSNPVDGQAYQLLASAYLTMGNRMLAIEAIKRFAAVTPGDEAQVLLATFLQKSGASAEAKEIMSRLLVNHADSPDLWARDIQLASDRKDWPEASRALDRLRQLPDTMALVATLDGQIKAARGDKAGAAASFRALIEVQPNVDPEVIGGFARASSDLNKYDEASSYLQQKLPVLQGPSRVAAWSAIMTLQADAGHFDRSAAAFDEVVKLSPASLPAYQSFVNILVSQKAYKPALEVVAKGMTLGAPKWAMLQLRGGIQERAGDLAAAQVSYKEASNDNPFALAPLNNYASLLSLQDPKNLTEIAEVRKRLQGMEQSTDVNVLDTIAWLEYRLGRFDEAKRLLLSVNAAQSEDPQIRFHLAAVLIASGDRTKGLSVLESVKGLDFPGSEEIQAVSAS